MLYLGTFGQEFQKTIFIFGKLSPSNLSKCKILRKKTKMPKFGTENALFGGFFGQNFRKINCRISNQQPQICQK